MKFKPSRLAALLLCLAAPAAFAAAPSMLVLNKIKSRANLPGNLVKVDVASGQVVWRVPVGKEPHEVAISDDGKLAIVSNTGNYAEIGHTLSLIDVGAGKEIRRIELGAMGMPHGLAFSKGKFYFTSEIAKALGRYDPQTDTIDWIGGTGAEVDHMLAISKDGTTLFSTERSSNTVAQILFNPPGTLAGTPPHPWWKLNQWPVCATPEGIALSADEKELWVGCRTVDKIEVLDTATGKVLRSMDTPTKMLVRLKFTVDGKYVLGTDLGSGNVVVIDPVKMVVIKTIATGTGCEGIMIAPDGRHAYIGDTVDNYVTELDLQTLTISRRISTGLGPDSMAWINN